MQNPLTALARRLTTGFGDGFGVTLGNGPAPFEALEGRCMMSADLAISVGKMTTGMDKSGVPTVKVPVIVRNVGDTPVLGGGNVEFYLSTDRNFDSDDFLFNTTKLPRVGGPGTSGSFTLNTKIPAELAPRVGRPLPAGEYYVIARIAPAANSPEVGGDNNIAVGNKKVSVTYTFGEVNGKKGVPLTITLPDGDKLTLKIDRGPGTGRVVAVDNRIVVIIDGVTTETTLRMDPGSRKQTPTINGLTINGNIKKIAAAGVNIDGDVTITGSVSSVLMENLSNSNFVVSGFAKSWDASFGKVKDSNITSNFIPISGLKAKRWQDTDATADRITAPWIDSITITENFAAGLSLSGQNKGFSLRSITVGKDISNGAWNLAASVEVLTANKLSSAWRANIRGTINVLNINGNASGTLAVGGIRRATIKGDVVNATYLIGANLGANVQLDGTNGGDQFNAGGVGVLVIRGKMRDSIIAAGLGTLDAQLLNDDDRLVPGGFMNSIEVYKGMTNSFFIAETLPTKAKISFRNVTTDNDARFIDSLPR